MTVAQDAHRSIGPALGGMVGLLVVIMAVVFTGFHQQEKHLERMLQVSDLNDAVTKLERQLTDGYRFLSLSSDDVLGSQYGVAIDEFVLEFNRRLASIDSLNNRVLLASNLVGVERGIQASGRVNDLRQSWGRVVGDLVDHQADATVELMTVSDPLSVELLTSDLPSLVEDIYEIEQQASARFDRVSALAFIIILVVFLAAYMIALILISHILTVHKERQKMESDLRDAMEQAKAASYEKSRFLSNMSHELRTPMNGVIGMANVLSSQTLPESQERLVSVLKQSADTALSLINDILDFEAIEAGKVTVESRTFELVEVTRKIKALASAQILDKPIDFSISVDMDLSRRFRGDEGRLVQVLNNLISNAIKFTEEGTVDVLIQREERSRVSFTVRDTGIGVDPDRIDTLFESFKQADNSIRRRYGGTGLGLSISRSLVHMMGGTISVTSTPGEGSVFVITLPLPAVASPSRLERVAEEETVVRQPRSLKKEPVHVLCVDDNLINLEVARVVIEEAGHVCLSASSGKDGLQILAENAVDVVFMDCHMDGLAGFETAKSMLERHPDLPIVALTADATTSAAQASQKAGMCGIMTKPFKPDVLIETVELLGREGCPDSARNTSERAAQGEVTASGVWSSSA